jgi:hypothetical protein
MSKGVKACEKGHIKVVEFLYSKGVRSHLERCGF